MAVTVGTGPARFVSAGQFGTADVQWRVQPNDDPQEVAAAVLHHLLIYRLREQYQGRFSSGTLRALTGGSERTALRLLTGESPASLTDLISWVAGAGPDLIEDLALDLASLLPPEAPPLSGSWRPGQWRRPSFASHPVIGIDWAHVAQRTIGLIETEDAAGRARLLTHAAVRHMVLTSITEAGVPAGLASVDVEIDEGEGSYDLLFDMGPDVEVVSVGWHLTSGRRQQLQESVGDFIQALHRTAVANADKRNHLAVMSIPAFERIQALARDFGAEPDTRFVLSFRSTRTLRPPGSEPNDIRAMILAKALTERWAVVAVALEKPEVSQDS